MRRGAGVMLVALTLGACDFISPIESNPNSVPEATLDQLFTGLQVNSFYISSSGLSRIASIWTQQMAGIARQHLGFDGYSIGEDDFDDEFDHLYTEGGLNEIRTAIAQAEAGGRRSYAGILKIHEAYMVGLISSFYGDIPYSQAVNPEFSDPVLDNQADVYAAVQSLLDAAIADLAAGGVGPGAVDMNFQGNVARWTAIAYTLKARFHMHWAEVNGATAYTAARTAAQSGINAVAGDWKARFGSASTETGIWPQFMDDRAGDVAAGEFLVPLMIGNSDPRIPLYYSSATPVARTSVLAAATFGADAFDFPMVTCAENLFILAEAEYQLGNEPGARTAAQAAIDCDEAEYTPPIDLSAVQTAIGGLSGAALFAEIMEQKYIAQFLNPDVFNDYKRTCLPDITERTNGMPGRLLYSGNERRANSNVPDAGIAPNGKYNDNDPTPCPVP
jgi:hypothetical protein